MKKGFTLVEVLVTSSVFGILAMLLLPGINLAREAARRTHCSGSLRQISAAVLNYESAQDVFPRSITLMPQAFGIHHSLFDCPSTPRLGSEKYDYGEAVQLTVSPTINNEIRVVRGAWYVPQEMIRELSIRPPYRGWASLRRIRDGTSRTFLVCESAGAPYVYEGRPAGHPLGPWPSNVRTNIRGLIKSKTTHYRHHEKGPQHSEFSGMDVNRTNDEGLYSFHPAGTNMAMCDGSVRFWVNGTDSQVMAEMFSRDGGGR